MRFPRFSKLLELFRVRLALNLVDVIDELFSVGIVRLISSGCIFAYVGSALRLVGDSYVGCIEPLERTDLKSL